MTIPAPERGQPIDTSLIYQIVEAVNSLTESTTPATKKYVTVRDDNRKASEARFLAKTVNVAPGIDVKAGETKPFTLSFGNDFKTPPVVTATIENVTETLAGKNSIVILSSVTATGVTGFVRFNENGTANIVVHIIAIGIPN